ncbi:glycosyltransferase family 4 protein [Sporolactobacillus nakayamae]|uniref:Glycosyltransferase involved in cell wall bisynthesis n=1 Tax=Sporolactobacillus nakayamae TaxID=269670 RepID=A0A1I2W1C7_9BACL|nr:glycosyltransferase family 1 protein [Sporolactobacillus nakayamae]SFG94489.1 Glycosyltransferase involved in cell wall bisynthesis [Sporolactobacillus nakayamae]
MKPLICIDMRMKNNSGIGRYITNIVDFVIRDMQNVEFCLLGDNDSLYQYKDFANVTIIKCSSKIYSISEQIEIIRKIPKNTLLFWSPHYNIPLFYRGNLLVTIHDLFHISMKEYVKGFIKKTYAKVMFKMISKKANKIMVVSKFTKAELMKFVSYKKEDIIITYNGVDQTWFHSEAKPVDNPPYLLYVGNIKPHKNLIKLIEGFEIIKHKIPHNLIIVGKKDGFITGDSRVNEFASKNINRIQFTGYVTDKELNKLFNNADIFVFPSLYEGFGLPPLEAMAKGIPVAASNIPPIKEICGDNAIYFNPYDEYSIARSIYKLINNQDLKEKLSIEGKIHAAEFTWAKSAIITEKVIADILLKSPIDGTSM